MARLPRFDRPGAWFHVMNRGIARRVVFPDQLHIRMFLALLACAVRRGELEVHAFCIMATHFHLLVRSPTGCLSVALARITNVYVRWSNRKARRDGPMFRGRFRSRPVLSSRYHDILVRYIEHNPVKAKIVARPEDYPYGSARLQARARRPRWLATWWVDDVLARVRHVDPTATYQSLWGVGVNPAERALVRARINGAATTEDTLDDLVDAAPERVQAWMEEKARLADGGRARAVIVSGDTVLEVVAVARNAVGDWSVRSARGPVRDLWAVATCGLLHDLAGQPRRACATLMGIAPSLAATLLTRHRQHMSEDGYAKRVAEISRSCLVAAHRSCNTSAAQRWAAAAAATRNP